METVSLAGKKREVGKSADAKRIRREGNVPAVLYGHGIEPVSLQVDNGELLRVLHTKAGENVIIQLALEGVQLKENTCQIKEIQHDPVTDAIEHVDFRLISMNETIEASVPVVAMHADESEGVKKGGVLDIVHHEIEVECLPTAIPDKITIDAKPLKIGDAIHVKDVKFPEGVSPLLEEDEVLIAIHAPRVEEETAAEEEPASEGPEVIEKGKKDKSEEEAAEKKG